MTKDRQKRDSIPSIEEATDTAYKLDSEIKALLKSVKNFRKNCADTADILGDLNATLRSK